MIVVKSDLAGVDGLVYGYAFRGQWLWHNNYGPKGYTYIIWKDYNCMSKLDWSDTAQRGTGGSTNVNVTNLINDMAAHIESEATSLNFALDDVWRVTKAFNEKLESEAEVQAATTLSIKVTSSVSFFSAQICYDKILILNMFVTVDSGAQKYSFTSFRTRSS